MSLTKRFMEQHEEEEALVQALQALLEDERISGDAAPGITKKVIADRGTEKLSAAQMRVYEAVVTPALKIRCEGHCEDLIPLRDIPGAISNEFEYGMLLCQQCLFDEQRLRDA